MLSPTACDWSVPTGILRVDLGGYGLVWIDVFGIGVCVVLFANA